MKLKNLRKKIRRLEKRLQEGPQRLAKLKRKLGAAEAAKKLKVARKSAATASARAAAKSKPGKKKSPAQIAAKKPAGAKKAKKKLNLSPERRAQLAAAMKARWAAKRAAEAQMKAASGDNQYSAPGPTPQAPQNRPDGV
jgi:hypothetical protein